MKCVGVGVWGGLMLAMLPSWAQVPAESGDAMSPFGMPAQSQPAAPPKPRPAIFAAASAAVAKRLPPEQREERRFLKDAAAASRFESEAAKLALSKSTNAKVRSFAATLAEHHASIAPALLRMLHDRGMAQPMLANDQRKALNRLGKLSGGKFDREFLDELGVRHQLEDLVLYERAALSARDPALKGWIDQVLPAMKVHLASAEKASPGDTRIARGAAVPSRPPAPVPVVAPAGP